ncbi:MAG: efflux RND transporter periplasmic adaptor subunit, partial [Deltaproteobacteria bacterium]
GAEVSGRLASVDADFNDHVRAGQVLARFDPALLRAQLLQAEGLLRAAEAAVRQAAADADHAVRVAARSEILHGQALVSDADFEDALVASRLADQRLHAAEAQRAAQQAAVRLARTNLVHGEIRSPIDGIVVTRNVDPGQTVASAFQTPVLFTVAADLRAMRAIAAVDEADIGEIQKGQKASFTVNAWPERTFSGVVSEVRNSPVVVQDVVTYQVVIGVANPDLLLKPGMTAAVRIRTAEARAALRVPNAALHFTPPGEAQAKAKGVWVLEGGKLQRREVTPGVSDGEQTAVSGKVPDGPVLVELTPEGRKAYAGGR